MPEEHTSGSLRRELARQLDAYKALIPDVGGIDFGVHREVSDDMGDLISEHANSHRNSNSPHGHSCPSSCLASSILLWQARQVEEILKDGEEPGDGD